MQSPPSTIAIGPLPDDLHRVPWPERFILVLSAGSLGDALQMSPLLVALRGRFPGRAIVLAHPSRAAAQALAVPGLVDLLLTINPLKDPSRLYRHLPRTGCELFARWRYVVDYTPLSSALSQEERAFLDATRPLQAPWGEPFFREGKDCPRLWRRAWAVGLNLYRLSALTAGFEGADFEALRTARAPDSSLARFHLPPRYLVVGNSAYITHAVRHQCTKLLPHPRMQALVRELRALGLSLVHLGASRDEPALEGIDHDLRGRTSIPEAAAVLARAASFVVPESGLSNLARAAGARGVVFFGSTPPEFFGFRHNINVAPRSCGGCWWSTPSYLSQCPRLQRRPDCVDSISTQALVSAVASQVSA